MRMKVIVQLIHNGARPWDRCWLRGGLVEGAPGEASNLQSALVAAQFRVHTVAAAAMPTSMIALSAFDAVVLINVIQGRRSV